MNEVLVSKEIEVAPWCGSETRNLLPNKFVYGSNFHRKEVTKLTFRAFALRRQFPIRLRR